MGICQKKTKNKEQGKKVRNIERKQGNIERKQGNVEKLHTEILHYVKRPRENTLKTIHYICSIDVFENPTLFWKIDFWTFIFVHF